MNCHHAGITDDFTISHYARDMEYGYEILVENLIDPAHVPFSHSGVGGITRKSVRIGDATGVPYVQFWIQVLHSNDGLWPNVHPIACRSYLVRSLLDFITPMPEYRSSIPLHWSER